MSEFKGTPGPWNIIRDKRSGEIVSIGPAYSEEYAGTCWIEISQANANLIAAAPDLLKALQLFVSEYVDLVESGDAGFWNAENENKVKLARAALAKALGETK